MKPIFALTAVVALTACQMTTPSDSNVSSTNFADYNGQTVTLSGAGLFSGNPFSVTKRIQPCKGSPSGFCFGDQWITEDGRITYFLDKGTHWNELRQTSDGLVAFHGFTNTKGDLEREAQISVTISG